ncbi:RNA-binding protein [Candidatus Thioglobus sp.]|uniref:RNA recognition motif domain-containing protein n=1 Tax=Candidatus Thioglobus sp. TaxID=2026721 RepID=UPI002601702F|nr:RNA-binding protein [Candidatus Thioglobus sp.]MDG2395775.1 RNA-binding protein [Candidatus Thioglobus sp.]
MKILIRNLPRTLSETSLNELFEAHGDVQSCNLILDQKTGESKGFGFVEITKVGDAKAAIQALNGKPINGNKIRVKKAEPNK